MTRALTVEQAAEYLQLSPYTVRQWLREGKLPGRKIGRVYRILESDLADLIRADRSPAAGAVRETAPDYSEVEAKKGTLPGHASSPRHPRQRITAASLAGKYRDPRWTVDDFMREKAAEVEEEEKHWEEKHRP